MIQKSNIVPKIDGGYSGVYSEVPRLIVMKPT